MCIRDRPMEQQKLDRISELARKSRTAGGLTGAERAEQMLSLIHI